ncbi:hypothetical protein [Dysgonomonas sp. ZJ709]|uniref:hypothetical protein n=1 Tax=Dysgonomonas sp. ZJ709 TaxID=2709797 RepID=UPI0013EC1E9F|nr:hypothetical protein [Dysgonomonas sp. ZJ709]
MFNFETMDAIFNIKRFINLEKRNIVADRMQYLYLIAASVAIYIISTVLFVATDSASLGDLIPILYMFVIIFAPCLLGKNISKNNSIFDFMLPASTFEKFLSLFLKYAFLIPFLCISILFILSGISSILPIEALNAHAKDLDLGSEISWYRIHKVLVVQSIFFLGYFYFRRYAFAKVCLALILFSLVLAIVFGSVVALYGPEHGMLKYKFSLGVSDKWDIMSGVVLPIGMWVISFFKLRETEI